MKVVAISDQHGAWPKIPQCDLLIVAGDQCLDNFRGMPARLDPAVQWEWFKTVWLPWRYQQPATDCVLTWGNHDFCGLMHQNSHRQHFGKGTTIACDQLVEVQGLKIYCSPWSNQFLNWAFMRSPAHLARTYGVIPDGLDILVSHQPPHGCGDGAKYYDLSGASRPAADGLHNYGSVELRDAIVRAKPKIVVCGHIHMGYGRYELDGIPVYNVSIVDEAYKLVHPPTVILDYPSSTTLVGKRHE